MPSEQKEGNAVSGIGPLNLDLLFSLYLSFANIVGIPIKLCGVDGQTLRVYPAESASGLCAMIKGKSALAGACSDNYAAAAAMAIELCQPYIFSCHMRLAAWAVPILQNNEPLPGAVICGGILLSKPDSALVRYVQDIAAKQDIDPFSLVQSLNSTPVVSREYLRASANFLFQMSAAFVTYAALPGASQVIPPPAAPAFPQTPVVFPPARVKETRKAQLQRSRMLELRNIETEIVRLLRERKPEAAFETLLNLMKGQKANVSGEGVSARFIAAEMFTRMFRELMKGARVPHGLQLKQSRLIADALSQRASIKSSDLLERLCRRFVLIAEELTGEPRPRKIKAIQKFLEKNMSKKLTLGTVGKKFGLKEKPLDALVRKHCGMGFTDYVASLRVSEAKRLLRSTDLNMGQIARRTGFKDQSYFTKVFKSRIGSTPSEFKNKMTGRPKPREAPSSSKTGGV